MVFMWSSTLLWGLNSVLVFFVFMLRLINDLNRLLVGVVIVIVMLSSSLLMLEI